MRRRMTVALASITIGLASCAHQPPQHIAVALPCPPRPVLPHVTAAELAPLAPDVYGRIRERERLMSNYADVLAAMCQATQGETTQ